jgi:lipoate-protein ligase B
MNSLDHMHKNEGLCKEVAAVGLHVVFVLIIGLGFSVYQYISPDLGPMTKIDSCGLSGLVTVSRPVIS